MYDRFQKIKSPNWNLYLHFVLFQSIPHSLTSPVSHHIAKEIWVLVRNLWIFPYLELSFFIQTLPSFSSYFIHSFSSYMRIESCLQKQTQFIFIFMFLCLLILFFSFNLLHLHCGILTEVLHHLLSDLFFRLPLLLWR